MGDIPLWLDLSQLTKFYYFDELFSVYRIIEDSVTRQKNKIKRYRFLLSTYEVRLYYCFKYNYPINDKLKNKYNKALILVKLYDLEFNELFPLQNPSFFDELILKKINKPLIRYLGLVYFNSYLLLKTQARKIRLFGKNIKIEYTKTQSINEK